MILAETFVPATAVAAGFLDEVVPEADVAKVAHDVAARFGGARSDAHAATKLRARAATLQAIREAIETDFEAFRTLS